MNDVYTQAAETSPLPSIAQDLVRRALYVLPIGLALGAVYDGRNGLLSVGVAMAVVAFNFLLSAYMLSWAVKISFSLVTSMALGGFLLRMLLIGAVIFLVKDMPWVNLTLLGITIVITHLGLLIWELRFVSASMAHPGLKPKSSGGAKPAARYR